MAQTRSNLQTRRLPRVLALLRTGIVRRVLERGERYEESGSVLLDRVRPDPHCWHVPGTPVYLHVGRRRTERTDVAFEPEVESDVTRGWPDRRDRVAPRPHLRGNAIRLCGQALDCVVRTHV